MITNTRFLELRRAISDHWLLVTFIGIALLARIAFWLYTGRIWEDALITLTTARNAWEGFGLTHHASEPRVHCFTSPIGVLIPLVGEAFGRGLFAVRLVSLGAAAAAIWYAYFLGRLLDFDWSALLAVLAYLALDHLQVFFGVAGMETQIATALVMANAYYWMTSQWWKLGIALGLGLICRPEFLFWAPIVGVAIMFVNYRALLPTVGWSAAIASPWVVFATLYYGSPVPNTIVAKTLSFRIGMFLSAGWSDIWQYFLTSWSSLAPFREFWFVYKTPFSDIPLTAVVLIVVVLAAIGIVRSFWHRPRMLAVAAFMLAFFAYRTGSMLLTYFMWYLPPFVGLLFLFAGYGISTVARATPSIARALGIVIAVAYAAPLPFVAPLDRRTQIEVDDAVRLKTGLALNALMGPADTAVIEPLGYIGWGARNKTIYDFPGLGSKIAVAALARRNDGSAMALTDALKPTFVVLRPREVMDFTNQFSATAALYTQVEHIRGATHDTIEHMGVGYGICDDDFVILRRAP